MNLPYILFGSAMVESPDGKGVLLFGGIMLLDGNNNTTKLDRIVELRAGT